MGTPSLPAKLLWVLAAFAGALLLAYMGEQIYVAATPTPERQTAQGMYAFGG